MKQIIDYINELIKIRETEGKIAAHNEQARANSWSFFQGVGLDIIQIAGDVEYASRSGIQAGRQDCLSNTQASLDESIAIKQNKLTLGSLYRKQKNAAAEAWKQFVDQVRITNDDQKLIKQLLDILSSNQLTVARNTFIASTQAQNDSNSQILEVLVPLAQEALQTQYQSLLGEQNINQAQLRMWSGLALLLLIASTAVAVVSIPPIAMMLATGVLIMSEGMLALHLLGALAACGGYVITAVSAYMAFDAKTQASKIELSIKTVHDNEQIFEALSSEFSKCSLGAGPKGRIPGFHHSPNSP